jgi:hypothetical protein
MPDGESGSPDHGASDPQHVIGDLVEGGPIKGNAGGGWWSIFFRSAAAVALGGCVGGCALLAVTSWRSWVPETIAGSQYIGADFVSKITTKQTVPLGFDQPWDRPRFYLLSYGVVQWIAPFFGNGSAGCLISEALGNAAPDKDEAERHFTDIPPTCPNHAHALFAIANIQFRRCISRGGVSECVQALESYEIAIPELKREPDDQNFYRVAVINRAAILFERPETRLSPHDLDNAAADVADVRSAPAKTHGQNQLKQFAADLGAKLMSAKVAELEQALAAEKEKSAELEKARAAAKKKLDDVEKTNPAQHKRSTNKSSRSSWHPCRYARNSKGETFPVDKCR